MFMLSARDADLPLSTARVSRYNEINKDYDYKRVASKSPVKPVGHLIHAGLYGVYSCLKMLWTELLLLYSICRAEQKGKLKPLVKKESAPNLTRY